MQFDFMQEYGIPGVNDEVESVNSYTAETLFGGPQQQPGMAALESALGPNPSPSGFGTNPITNPPSQTQMVPGGMGPGMGPMPGAGPGGNVIWDQARDGGSGQSVIVDEIQMGMAGGDADMAAQMRGGGNKAARIGNAFGGLVNMYTGSKGFSFR
jgi:hypothetical protein